MSNGTDRIREAMIFEGTQAWEHYRHVENQRNSFLAFYFTIALASVGLIATLAARSDPDAVSTALVVACPLLAAVASLGALTYWSVERFRYILDFYRRILLEVRMSLFHGFSQEIDTYARDIDVVRHLPPLVSGRFRGPQAAAETSCGASATIFGAIPIAVAVSTLWASYPLFGLPIIFATAVYILLLAAYAGRHQILIRRFERSQRRDRGHL